MKTTSRRSFIRTSFFSGLTLFFSRNLVRAKSIINKITDPFKPNYDSLRQYECPAWFRDAKFGIFLHYGLNTVPGMNGHYGRFMYLQKKDPQFPHWAEWGKDVYQYHLDTYGHPSEFGYKDFVPLWKADKFDAEKLGAYFKSIGARYVVPVAVHSDNFDNWNSKHHRWNAKNMGPKIDFIGEWKKACDKLGLRFGVSEHMSTHIERWFHGTTDLEGPKAGIPYDTVNPDYEDFYVRRDPKNRNKVHAGFRQNWYNRMKDLLDSYEPDLFYFDGSFPYKDTGEGINIVTHFYNSNMERNNGKNEAVMCIKTHGNKEIEGTCVDDIERGQSDKLREIPWQTDTTINQGWFYLGKTDTVVTKVGEEAAMKGSKDKKLLDGPMVIQNLCDIVSKNGNLLLNVGQRADGSIPDLFKKDLDVIGQWLKINGEAIYETRPWKIYGEGPTIVTAGHFKEPSKPFVAEDIRFTTKGNFLYAMAMGIPKKPVEIKALGKNSKLLGKQIAKIELLGNAQKINWEFTAQALVIDVPKKIKSKHAVAFKITLS
ncbi:alpha-L-fucosidase [Fulvivirgaceae bacterium BMA12]|uniref:alpha-L-fucosidase n=1 Tax=Agaribacillus aureus TaxID=3051825 RepID=A0ABT8LGK5_9BACT|nr:alpha-L-fucosidase [Fulvivirgaceae bacterium BMA12]